MIKLIVLDVDGTLSDGNIIYSDNGAEIKAFNVKDGLGIATWIKLGRQVAIITGRKSKLVENRARELNITYIKQGIKDKAQALKEILTEANIALSEVAIIGDDLNDLSMLRLVKHSYAPKDAAKIVKQNVRKVLKQKGGKGAVRAMIDVLIKKENLEAKLYGLFV
ncbi:KdsC family phosphatase [Helicobacter turcicus]|uniref:HAD-IIIA family hydrolase n=1 Tax=Helicobacter turcicus TaxID=2867412 RepID=A0ABS7JMG7_9HELI|nr:HAD-IIIA family hydrolase [Helicobacter turcicus]MBX7490588.1 HAD-IIIA family hydrolase [Helicobacter turcicus]MBX7545502.1 HAD-IIIA family hydrolase [Helicobacter turcicus]